MNNLGELLSVVLPVIIMPVIGMLCRRFKVITGDGAVSLQNIELKICLPVILFSAFYTTEIAAVDLVFPAIGFGAVVASIFLGKLFLKLTKNESRYAPYHMAGMEVGMLGYALLDILGGVSGLKYLAITDIGHTLAVFTIYIAFIKRENGQQQSVASAIVSMLKMPLIIGLLLGVLFSVTGAGRLIDSSPAGAVFIKVLNFVKAPAGALILIAIGYKLQPACSKMSDVFKILLGRYLISALLFSIFFLVLKLIFGELDRLMTISMLLFFILPAPYILPLIIDDDAEQRFASTTLSIGTLISLALFVVLVICISVGKI